MAQQVTLGLDIGGTNSKAGLVTRAGDLLAYRSFPSHGQKNFRDFLDQFKQELAALKKEVGPEVEIVATGIGAPVAHPKKGIMDNDVPLWQPPRALF